MLRIFAWIILILGLINLTRIALYMTGADWHDVKHHRRKRKLPVAQSAPWISIVVPAHNEERVIVRNLISIYKNPYSHKEVIVVNDGSTDRTLGKVREAAGTWEALMEEVERTGDELVALTERMTDEQAAVPIAAKITSDNTVIIDATIPLAELVQVPSRTHLGMHLQQLRDLAATADQVHANA